MAGGERLCFNGIDGRTGAYLRAPVEPGRIAEHARRERGDRAGRRDLKSWVQQVSEAPARGPRDGIDPCDLAEAGWGAIFPAALAGTTAGASIREALSPLLDLRREQACRRKERLYRELTGDQGYRAGESKVEFQRRHGAGPGPVDPENLPYYLLLVGEPEETPFTFQHQLDVPHAVGRVAFDTDEEYRCYAESVVAAERGGGRRARRAAFFAPANPGDPSTTLSREQLVCPLSTSECAIPAGWKAGLRPTAEETRQRLAALLAGDGRPALLFAACHGLGFPAGDPAQRELQGALLCQDWPGPRGGCPERGHYLAGEDLPANADVHGLVAFCFACYGAGTPAEDEFPAAGNGARRPLAPRPFVSRLAQRLLAHPRGGALALLGHVERAWTFSFAWTEEGRQIAAFESCVRRLLEGKPVGWALEPLNQRYAELATDLAEEIESLDFGRPLDERRLAALWTASRDARNFAVIGDPAVRLTFDGGGL